MSDTPEQRKRRLRIIFAVAVLVGAIVLLVVTELASVEDKTKSNSHSNRADERAIATASDTTRAPAAARPVTPSPVIEPGPTAVRAFAANPLAPPAPLPGEYAEVAALLNRPDRTARDDVSAVAEIVLNHMAQFHEAPVGSNAEITAALAGDNPRGHAGLPPGHPAINAKGELTDRWGTPYFFHQIASDLMEIRSAGPDRRMFSDDDVVWPQGEQPTVAQAAP